jgi:hypothetical protein
MRLRPRKRVPLIYWENKMTELAGMGHNTPPTAGPYAIYRTAKIKTHSQVVASANHMTRAVDTPNADPDRAHLNRILIGSTDPAADVMRLLPKVGQRHPETDKVLRRTNSVLAIEILITTSPEWWAEATEPQRIAWEIDSLDWLKAEYGEANIAHMRLHGDETTPHMTGYIVPLDPDTGGLNCRRWIGEKQQLRDQQTAYALAVEHLGLQRGVRGSTATHEAVRRVYGAITAPQQVLKVPAPSRVTMSPEAWAAEASAQMMKDIQPTVARAAYADTERTRRKSAEAQTNKERGRADRAEIDRDAQKAVADRMRALPIPDVLDALGLTPDPKDKTKWRGDGFIISPGTGEKSGKWFDHAADYGRGGAIDLVAHVLKQDFKGSVSWLADHFGEAHTVATVTASYHANARRDVRNAVHERPAFTPPSPAPEHWPDVRRWLIEDRSLPEKYIDQLHRRGDIYADERRNAVFLCRDPDTDKVVGAELKGTAKMQDGSRFAGLALGSRKDQGGFRLGPLVLAKVVYLVESAIDAISLYTLRRIEGETDFAVVSTAGARGTVPTFLNRLRDSVARLCAFDNDKAGNDAAKKLGWDRLRPDGHDWNDDLAALSNSTDTTSTTPPDPDPSSP